MAKSLPLLNGFSIQKIELRGAGELFDGVIQFALAQQEARLSEGFAELIIRLECRIVKGLLSVCGNGEQASRDHGEKAMAKNRLHHKSFAGGAARIARTWTGRVN